MQSQQSEPLSFPPEQSFTLIVSELQRTLQAVLPGQVAAALDALTGAERIFFVGAGRSALALRMAAMRLMHLGLRVHVAGDVTTPAIGPCDLLVAASASGTTKTVLLAADVARTVGAGLLVVTTAPASPLAQLADHVVTLPAASKTELAERASAQYAGSLFEQAVLLLFDGIFHSLWKRSPQSTEQLSARHANLE